MDLGLKDKVAVVTGASQGIGWSIARGLAAEGCKVSICSRSEENLKKAALSIKESTGIDILTIKADLRSKDDIQEYVKSTIGKFGRIDIAVNNSGGPPIKYFMDISEEEWLDGMKLNLMSTIHLTKEVVPHMKKAKSGSIVNITSISAKQPLDKFTISNTMRAGIIGIAKSLSNELGQYGIRVNNVCPGFTMTERLSEVFQEMARQKDVSVESVIAGSEDLVPLKRVAKPSEIADLVVYLCSQRASYITGTTIQADGGYVKGLF